MGSNDVILIAEDNPEDAELMREALRRAGIHARAQYVTDGEEAISYLSGSGEYQDREANPLPRMILLDLKMPRKDGLEVLEWIKANPHLKRIPTLMLSSSNLSRDVERAYEFGANTYFMKPNNLNDLVEVLKSLKSYWEKAEMLSRELTRKSK
jgi:CheY-like chemotaxis protein